ncbi:hypothetical protein BS50DRAFT_5625 [Corynespora cassiicola Philippines]|uniref:Ubiquitin 3 binding protein But2 C-terminal domain-containing protein n=1 Tax=Corynespora cassiicola Philippines TaxID=1448308 RepID=A0A2T2P8K9_CORCC|nr:hypothetical protein BS50DRAFT_5625 [Corynespora cassiicola Philippines]
MRTTILATLLPLALARHPHTVQNETTSTTAPAPACSATAKTLPPACQTAYPLSLRIMNSRYPAYEYTPLHSETAFFMALRQEPTTFQIATQVQFTGLPQDSMTCWLELLAPVPSAQSVKGPRPVLNVFAVERPLGAQANWNTYGGGDNKEVFGTVDVGTEAAVEMRRLGGGFLRVGETSCNGTLTFHVAMKYDGGDAVNYWDFVQANPPMGPEQGWRIVHSC